MTDPFRAELTVTYSIRERHDWASQERLARQARVPAPRATHRRPRPEFHLTGLLGRLVRAHAV